jgi:putative flippase GtrA
MTGAIKRLVRVVLAGGIATAVDALVLGILYFACDVPAGRAALAGALAGGAVNFVLNRTWVFSVTGSWWRQALLYGMVVVGGAVLGSAIVATVHGFGVPVMLAKVAAIGIVLVAWTYPMSARVVFASRDAGCSPRTAGARMHRSAS